MGGWIRLYRSLSEWEWIDDHPTLILWIHCLLMANHAETQWRGHAILPGQFVSSIAKLSDKTSLTNKQVRCAINRLKRTGEMASQSTNEFTLFTINSWKKYQPEKQEGKPEGEQRASGGQAEGKQRATNNNEKKEKNDEEENTIGQKQVLTDLFPEEIPAVNSSKIDKEKKTLSTFEAFWENYPRKQGKVPALRIWRSMSQDDRAAAAAALPAYTRSISDPQFYQHGDTFLRQKTFLEVIDPQTEALRTSFRKLTEMGCTEQQIETDMNRHYGTDWRNRL